MAARKFPPPPGASIRLPERNADASPALARRFLRRFPLCGHRLWGQRRLGQAGAFRQSNRRSGVLPAAILRRSNGHIGAVPVTSALLRQERQWRGARGAALRAEGAGAGGPGSEQRTSRTASSPSRTAGMSSIALVSQWEWLLGALAGPEPSCGVLTGGRKLIHSRRGDMAQHRGPQTLQQSTRDDATDPQCCKGQCQASPCKRGTWAFPPGPKCALTHGILHPSAVAACGGVTTAPTGDPHHRQTGWRGATRRRWHPQMGDGLPSNPSPCFPTPHAPFFFLFLSLSSLLFASLLLNKIHPFFWQQHLASFGFNLVSGDILNLLSSFWFMHRD
ncbi:uncharacterized protein LOC116444028 isoform X1 [Corvus moneduloides]|uniref:uncharacterized protein LOC116444028 isoform X1 n=1 Tax=Corvus moneduloides TaxID=1196302 RepID=UPI0013628F87|nr:uncharacterized protein LOC116444028 isoform X1 [Corvus moneduloides]